ncbi:hypothetical protein LNV23_23910, partial [Paucibacter sp. DJ1R-11]|uniref:hypothetical protein n=1 Tax=Paucibacter sp. DJ1R-11 TaxID=2893556 RepID=UPI0021E4AFBC
ALIPDDVLALLRPIEATEARTFYDLSMAYLGKDSLAPEFSSSMKNTEAISNVEGTAWLAGHQPTSDAEVILSWDPEVALKTSWAIFAKYWQEFCYPSSDDLVVFPSIGDWVLLYHHEEQFHFGRRKDDV